MKKFCPNCGAPLKEGDRFCKNCGKPVNNSNIPTPNNEIKQNIKKPAPTPNDQPLPQTHQVKQDQPVQPHMSRSTQIKRSSKKKIIAIWAAVVVVLLAVGGFVFYSVKGNNQANVAHSSKVKHPHKKKANTANKHSEKTTKSQPTKKHSVKDEYSNDVWTIMGYLAYARKNYRENSDVSSTADLVDAVSSDFSDDTLTADKHSSNTYTISNKYGSVDVTVNDDDVEVTNDGDKVITKSLLKEEFSKYKDQIDRITEKIGQGSSSDDDSDSDDSDFDSHDVDTNDNADDYDD